MELLPCRVMIFGTFDVFHPGHEFFIRQAMSKGKGLVVVVARDETVRRIKGFVRNTEKVRQKVLQEAFPEAVVVLGDLEDPLKVVREYQPSLICLGYDQVGFSEKLRAALPELPIERMEAFQPEKYKSSKMG